MNTRRGVGAEDVGADPRRVAVQCSGIGVRRVDTFAGIGIADQSRVAIAARGGICIAVAGGAGGSALRLASAEGSVIRFHAGEKKPTEVGGVIAEGASRVDDTLACVCVS